MNRKEWREYVPQWEGARVGEHPVSMEIRGLTNAQQAKLFSRSQIVKAEATGLNENSKLETATPEQKEQMVSTFHDISIRVLDGDLRETFGKVIRNIQGLEGVETVDDFFDWADQALVSEVVSAIISLAKGDAKNSEPSPASP
jgi:hypothetical protein